MSTQQVRRLVARISALFPQTDSKLLDTAARMALRSSEGDESIAFAAIRIVEARPNRVRNCVRLLLQYEEQVVEQAYSLHPQLEYSLATLWETCQWVQSTQRWGWNEDDLLDFLEWMACNKRLGKERRVWPIAFTLLERTSGNVNMMKDQIRREFVGYFWGEE
jgi:hypothetical protein